MSTMVIILAGNSEIGAHVHSESGSYYLERGGSGHLHSLMPPVRVPNSEKKYYKSKIIFNPDYGRFYRLITHIETYINLFPSIYILLPTFFSVLSLVRRVFDYSKKSALFLYWMSQRCSERGQTKMFARASATKS